MCSFTTSPKDSRLVLFLFPWVCIDVWNFVAVKLCLYSSCFLSNTTEKKLKLEGHSVERIYFRQRSSDGSVNKTIIKPRLALAARRQYVYVAFSRRKIPRSSAAAGSLGKAAKFRSLYDIEESNLVPGSRLWSESGTKVNQFVRVLTSVNTQYFIHIHARVFD